jgi:DNA-binding MarR family transcriptional regulator
MNLTGRQEEFLGEFLSLYGQAQEPLHYSRVAEVLGVGKITAYDMLRLLEKRELVRSEYVLRGKGQGAGRSTILFVPTPKAHTVLAEMAGEDWDKADWEVIRSQILDALREKADYQDMLEEILTNLPGRTTPLVYAAEMATAVILNLRLVEEEGPTSTLVEQLEAMGLPGEVGLNALAGLAVGLARLERTNRRWKAGLLGAIDGYQQSVARLGGNGKRCLSSFVQEVMRAVTP